MTPRPSPLLRRWEAQADRLSGRAFIPDLNFADTAIAAVDVCTQ